MICPWCGCEEVHFGASYGCDHEPALADGRFLGDLHISAEAKLDAPKIRQ